MNEEGTMRVENGRSKVLTALGVISGLLLAFVTFIQVVGPYSSLSFIAFILPLCVAFWLVVLFIYGLYTINKRGVRNGYLSLSLILVYLLWTFILWPPFWLLRTSSNFENLKSELRHETPISVMTWNIQRFGDLKPFLERKEVKKEKLACIQQAVSKGEQVLKTSIGLFAFQEVSNRNLKQLEDQLNLDCQHIGYHHRKNSSGLGICVKKTVPWTINYARNIILNGKGRWRALFAELSHQANPNTTFNLINVHFLPHRMDAKKVKQAFSSPKKLVQTISKINETSEAQRQQAEGLLSVIKDYKDPTLLVGDFNAPPYTGAHPLLQKNWEDVWGESGTSFGATKYFYLKAIYIPYRVDFTYALKSSFRLIDSKVLSTECSDHQPVISLMGLPKP